MTAAAARDALHQLDVLAVLVLFLDARVHPRPCHSSCGGLLRALEASVLGLDGPLIGTKEGRSPYTQRERECVCVCKDSRICLGWELATAILAR